MAQNFACFSANIMRPAQRPNMFLKAKQTISRYNAGVLHARGIREVDRMQRETPRADYLLGDRTCLTGSSNGRHCSWQAEIKKTFDVLETYREARTTYACGTHVHVSPGRGQRFTNERLRVVLKANSWNSVRPIANPLQQLSGVADSKWEKSILKE